MGGGCTDHRGNGGVSKSPRWGVGRGASQPIHTHTVNGRNTFTINQQSQTAIINWQSFSIDVGELTQFIHPNADAATLNRVVGNNLSEIYGTLQANGSVYLINPNGIIVGASGTINTQRFIASTLDVSNAEFLDHIENGSSLNFVGDSHARIINLGHIEAMGGDVYLIAHKIENNGTIKADGHVGVGAGSYVTLLGANEGTGQDKLAVRIAADDANIDQAGLIEATQIELRAANNNPYALAINHTGISRANGVAEKEGRIILLAEGSAEVDGTFDASASTTGNGGFVETSATQHIRIADTVKIDTSAANGETGTWLIDPEDIEINSTSTIAGASLINASTIENNLATTNVVIETDDGMAGNGDITVNQAINHTANSNDLTLNADRHIVVNQAVSIGGDIHLNSSGDISGTGLLSATDINLTTDGVNGAIGSSAQAINLNASGTIRANAANGTGGIFIGKQGDFDISNVVLDAGTGDATLTAINGNLSTGLSAFNFSGASLTLATTEQASNNTAGDRNITIGTGGIAATGTALVLNSADDIVIGGAIDADSLVATAGDGKDGVGYFDLASDPNPLNGGRTGSHGERGGNITVTSNGHITTHVGNLSLGAGAGGNGAIGEASSVDGADDLSGDGGNSGGTGGNGGAGGLISVNAELIAQQDIMLTAGAGGHGGHGGDGSGDGGNGNVFASGGDSGGMGSHGGTGGSVTINAALVAQQNIMLTAGSGGNGGIGGLGFGIGQSSGVQGGNSGGTGGHGGTGGSVIINAALVAQEDIILTAGAGLNAGHGADGDNVGGGGVNEGTSGGTGGDGGAGGAISINATLSAQQDILLTAGAGGNARYGGDSIGDSSGGIVGGSGGNGGVGGAISINDTLSAQHDLLLTVGVGGIRGVGGKAIVSGDLDGVDGVDGISGQITGSQIDATSSAGQITVNGVINADAGSSVSLSAFNTLSLASDIAVTGAGDLFLQASNFSSGNSFSSEDGDITLISRSGDLTLANGFSASSTGAGNIVLVADNNLVNNTGGFNPLTVNAGRWLIYSQRPDQNTNAALADMSEDFVRYNASFDSANPMPNNFAAGNGMLFAVQPRLTGVAVTVNNQAIDYGQTFNSSDFSVGGGAPASFEVCDPTCGVINAVDFGLSLPASLNAADVELVLDPAVTLSNSGFVNAGSYADGLVAGFKQGTALGDLGIGISGAGDLNVNAAALVITANDDTKVFDGVAYSGGNGVSVEGFVNGDSLADLTGNLSFSGTSQGAVSEGSYSLSASGLSALNYMIRYVPGTLQIVAAPEAAGSNEQQRSAANIFFAQQTLAMLDRSGKRREQHQGFGPRKSRVIIERSSDNAAPAGAVGWVANY